MTPCSGLPERARQGGRGADRDVSGCGFSTSAVRRSGRARRASSATGPLAIEAAQIAGNVVAALLDIKENQIYQSSRRYLYHAVIGAIAIANKQGGARGSRTSTRSSGQPRTSSATPSPRHAPTNPTSTRPPSSSAPSCPTTYNWPAAASPNGPMRHATRSPCSPGCRRCGGSSTTRATCHCERSSRRGTSSSSTPTWARSGPRTASVHAVHPADAPRAAPAPGSPAGERAPAGAAAGRRGALRRAARTSSTRSPPTALPAWSLPSGCNISRSSEPLQSTSRRSSRASSTSFRAASCSGWATPTTQRRPLRSQWPSTRP